MCFLNCKISDTQKREYLFYSISQYKITKQMKNSDFFFTHPVYNNTSKKKTMDSYYTMSQHRNTKPLILRKKIIYKGNASIYDIMTLLLTTLSRFPFFVDLKQG